MITGTLLGQTVFSTSGTLGNTFGNFVRVDNPHMNALVDTVTIQLSNGPSCCPDPIGIDNIALRR